MANIYDYSVSGGSLDPRVYYAYQPALQMAYKDISSQGDKAAQDMYAMLAKRGMLSSGLLPGGISDISRGTQEAMGGLYSKVLPEMARQSIALEEARRQEQEATKWGLINTAIKFLSPLLMTPIYGAAFSLGQNLLGKEIMPNILSGAILPKSSPIADYFKNLSIISSPQNSNIYGLGLFSSYNK